MNPTCSHCVGYHDRVGGKEYCAAADCVDYSRFQRHQANAAPIFAIGEEVYYDGELRTVRDISWFETHRHWNYYDKPYGKAHTFMNNDSIEKKADFEKKIASGSLKNCKDCGEMSCSEKHGDKWTRCCRWHKREGAEAKEEKGDSC